MDDKKPRGYYGPDPDLIDDDIDQGTDPDVKVLDLSEDEIRRDGAALERKITTRQKWLDSARTMVWEGSDEHAEELPGEDTQPRVRVVTPPPASVAPASRTPPPAAVMPASHTPPPEPRRPRAAAPEATPRPRHDTGRPQTPAPEATPRPRRDTGRPRTLDLEPEPPPRQRYDTDRPRIVEPIQSLVVPDEYDEYDDPRYAVDEEAPRGAPRLEAPLRISFRTVERISPDSRLKVMIKPESSAAEQYRVLSLKLREERNIRVVAVASPTTQEDSHIVATNLALALSEGARSRVVLIDTNLRGASIADLFDVQDAPGLAEQIRNHRRNPDLSWEVLGLSSSLSFLPSGPIEKNPSTLLNSEVLSDLMDELRRYFDFIMMATPPIMESADVNILQDFVDAAVLVARAGKTRRDTITRSINRLGEERFIGTVLMDVKEKKHG